MSYGALKLLHLACVYTSIGGFSLRSILMWYRPDALNNPWVKRLPHVVDTFLLLSGIGLLYATQLSPLHNHWLGLKLVLLVAYITFGALGLRYGPNRTRRLFYCVIALTCVLSMIWLALHKPVIF